MTETQVKELLALAAKSKQAEFLEVTDRLPGISRDVASVVWTAARLIKKAERLEKFDC